MGRIAGVTAEETRKRLLDAAAQIIEAKGYEGATVAQIAREAGVTTGAIYAHYNSKADLLVDALRMHRERTLGSLLAVDEPSDASALLVALAVRLRERDEDEASLLVEALLASRRDAELAQVLAGALAEREQAMAGLLAEGQARGELTADVSAEAAARFALMLGIGSFVVGSLDLASPEVEDWTSFIRRFVGAFTEETSHDPD